MRLLLIEDDLMIGKSLVRGLSDDGNGVDWVRDGESAIAALRDRHAWYALALLDWGLPRQDGLAVLKALRDRRDAVPVVMITARDSLDDRVRGLDAGADDYLVKPFELAELKARIRSVLRRHAGRAQNDMTCGALLLDPVTHTVTVANQPVDLTAREFSLVYALMERPGAVLSRSQLEERLYARDEAVESNAIEFIIHGVRRKLGAATVENVRGVGWRIGTPP